LHVRGRSLWCDDAPDRTDSVRRELFGTPEGRRNDRFRLEVPGLGRDA
jgi:hypothetical protein